MKKVLLAVLFVVAESAVSGQQLPTVAVATFEPTGGITQVEASNVTQLFVNTLAGKAAVKIVDRHVFDTIMAEMKFQVGDWSNRAKTTQFGEALNATTIIRGQVMKMGNTLFLSATMIDVKTTQIIATANTQMDSFNQLLSKLPEFCTEIANSLPQPNYFVGTWQSGDMTIVFTDKGGIQIGDRAPDDRNDGSAGRYYFTGGAYSYSNDTISISYQSQLQRWHIRQDYEPQSISSGSVTTNYKFNATKTTFELSEGFRVTNSRISGTYKIFTKAIQ